MPGMLQPQRVVTWLPDDAGVMVSSTSLLSRKVNTMTLAVTRAQWDAWQGGEHIQNAMPHLSPSEREFLLSGATPEEWDAEFGECEVCGATDPSECNFWPPDPSVKCKWPRAAEPADE
jgi:hypothetical protein